MSFLKKESIKFVLELCRISKKKSYKTIIRNESHGTCLTNELSYCDVNSSKVTLHTFLEFEHCAAFRTWNYFFEIIMYFLMILQISYRFKFFRTLVTLKFRRTMMSFDVLLKICIKILFFFS